MTAPNSSGARRCRWRAVDRRAERDGSRADHHLRRVGSDQLLGKEEPSAAEQVAGRLVEQGAKVVLRAHPTSVTRSGGAGEVTVHLRDGRAFSADELRSADPHGQASGPRGRRPPPRQAEAELSERADGAGPPRAAILGVGAMRTVLVRVDGKISARRLMTLTLSCDHRILYGADAAAFLSAISELLAQPLRPAL